MTTETRAKQMLRDLADHIRRVSGPPELPTIGNSLPPLSIDPDVETLRQEIAESAMEDDDMSPEEAAQFAEQFVAILLAMSPTN